MSTRPEPLTTRQIGARIREWWGAPALELHAWRLSFCDLVGQILHDLGLRDFRVTGPATTGAIILGGPGSTIIPYPGTFGHERPRDLAATLGELVDLYEIYGRRCLSCGNQIFEHQEGKCLFDASEMIIQPFLDRVEEILSTV